MTDSVKLTIDGIEVSAPKGALALHRRDPCGDENEGLRLETLLDHV